MCRYEVRNTAVIRVVVTALLGVITLLTFYMAYLALLEPVLAWLGTARYTKHTEEEVRHSFTVTK